MKRPDVRHYTEEELLMHVLRDEAPEVEAAIIGHFETCHECRSVYQEYEALVADIRHWMVPELAAESWEAQKTQLLTMFRQDRQWMRRKGILHYLKITAGRVWDYALENPLPTMGYVAAAVAFASERTITTFRLDRVLPATTEVFKFIRQVL
jgi:hypothetical protein